MRKIYLLLISVVMTVMANAQITVTNPGNTTPGLAATYADLATAVTALNAQTAISGPVTIAVDAANPQTAPAGGYTINAALTGASSTNTVTFEGNSNTVTAPTTHIVGSLHDAIFEIIGSDFITIQNFTMLENAANTTTAAATNNMTEFGVALFYLTTTNGAQNITIQNNTIDLNRTYQNTFGIYSNSTHTATAITVSATATTTAGGNSNLKIYGNTITDVNQGICIVGPTAAADMNTGLDIGGGGGGQANSITNWGTTGTFSGYVNVSGTLNCILVRNSIGFNVSYNTLTSSVGGNTVTASQRAVYVPSFSIAPTGTFTNTINNNNISVQSGIASGTLNGIINETTTGTATSSLFINSNNFNTFGHTAASPTGACTFINSTMTHLNTTINSNTFTAISLGTTGSTTFISNSVTVPATGSQTINSNSIVTSFNKTGAGGTVTGITTAGSSTTVTSNWNGNNFSNMTVTGATTLTFINQVDGGSVNHNIIGNTFSTITGGTSTVTGINSSFGGANGGSGNLVSGNIITNISGGGTVTGISLGGSATTQTATSNTINNLSSTGASSIVTGIAVTGSTTTNVSSNTINTLSGSGATSPVVNGISVSSGTTVNIFKNKICDLLESGAVATTSPAVNGMLFSGGTTVTAYNNLIGDLRATSASLSDAIRGISITSATATTTFNVYFNTVLLNATSIGASFGTTGIFHTASTTSTTATLNLRNNIIVNNSTPFGAGLTVAYRRSSGAASTLANYASTSNNNLFYAGTPGASNLIYSDGTGTATTLAAYKAGVFTAGTIAPRDASSVTENPPFLSTTCGNANFLHIDPAIATQIESGAATITSPFSITDDYDGNVRNVTTPDIGADEGTFILADVTGPGISYTTLGNTSCLTDRTLSTVTITDPSGVNIAAATRPRLYYKKSGNANTFADNTSGTDGWKFVEATGAGGSPFSFTTDYSLLFGGVPVLTNVIQYFVVAQDNVIPTPNVGINSGTFAATPTSVALTAAAFPLAGTINIYTLVTGGLSGTVTIGAAGTYPNLTVAGGLFDIINGTGLSGNLTANIIDAGIAENGAAALNAINYNGCAAGPYTLTIKPDVGVTTALTGSLASGALIKLNGAVNVTIDGSNSGGNTRDMTISNTATTAPTAVSIASLGTGLGAANNTIKNCNISTGVATTIGYGISVGGSTPGTSGADNDNVTIQNNSITVAPIGIYAIGTASVSAGGDDNLSITGNTIDYNNTTTGLASLGIRVGNSLNSSVSQNTVSEQTSASQSPTGISLETGFVSSTVTRNKITASVTTNALGYGGRGITVGTGTASSSLTIANNVIYGVNGTNWSGFSNSSSMGIAIGMVGNSSTITTIAGGINLYFNSVHMYGSMGPASTTAITTALYIGSGASALNIRDNIFANTQTGTSTTQKNYAIYSAAANTAFTTINYNDYYVSNSFNAPSAIPGFIGSDRVDLAGIQAGFGSNLNSITGNPAFNSNTNLQPNLGSPVLAAGENPNATGITTDFLGTARATPPTMGAYEVGVDGSGPVITYTALSNTCATSARTLTASITDISGVPTAGAGLPVLYWRINAGSWNAATGTYISGSNYDFTFGSGVVVTNVVQYYIVAQDNAGTPNVSAFPSAGAGGFTINPPAASTPPTTPSSYTIQSILAAGTYTVGTAGTYPTLTAAVAAYNTSCLGGAIVFELLDASYTTAPTGPGETFPIVINKNADASATNTLTIRPASGVTAAFTATVASGPVLKILSNYVTVDGSNNGSSSRDLTITNNSATTPSVVWMGSTGVTPIIFDVLKNCIIVNGVNTASAVVVSDGTTSGTAGYFSNITIQNNSIQKAYIGVFANAALLGGNGSGLDILTNDLSATGANAIRFVGIYVQGADGATVQNNTIGNFDGASSEDDKGIWFATGTINSTASANNIFNLNYTGTVGYGGHGIYVSSGTASANDRVINNMFNNLSGDGWDYTSVPTDNPIGIVLVGTQSGINVYYNTINLSGNTLNQTLAMSMGIYLGAGSVANIRDNIVVNNLGLLAATGYGSAGVYAVTSNAQFTAIDFNDYYVNPTGSGVKYIGQIAAAGSSTLAAWQAATGQDANSRNVLPVFVSSTDLHLSNAAGVNCQLDGTATPIAGITTDFDSQVRDAAAPDMGADEFTSVPAAALAAVSGGSQVCSNVVVSGSGTIYKDASCNVITKVLPNGGSPVSGMVNSCVKIEFPVPTYNGQAYVQRHFDITPAVNQSTATARVTLYVYQIEFDDYNSNNGLDPDLPTGPGDAPGIANLRITKYSGNGTLPGTYVPGVATFINPADADIVWDALNNWWTISFDVTGFSGFFIHTGFGPLPVSILNFSGYKDGSRNQLRWTTSSEQNNSGFEVQRSTDGINYTALGFVNSLAPGGNSTIELNYAFTDNNVTGSRQYYRLRQVNFNGSSKLSNIVLIKGDKPLTLMIDGLFPNPASTVVNVLIAAPNKDKLTMLITDIAGRTVIRQSVNVETGSNTIPVDISTLSGGTYMVKLVCSSNCEGVVGKFVKN